MAGNDIFKDLFVLEMANNHWGSVERGLRVIREHAAVARRNSVRAAIKLQLRDVDAFIHPAFKGNRDIRYIRKTEATCLPTEGYQTLTMAIREAGCIPMATPFDEASVALCVDLGLPIIKIASSDANDRPLIEAIAETGRPAIVSSGGSGEGTLDGVVALFERRGTPLAINHCVSLYPTENGELELNQIDYLKRRYPGHVIGLSSHECRDWRASMHISYAKGARTWERHVDVDAGDGHTVSPYCSLPSQTDEWFKAWRMAKEMCGGPGDCPRACAERETAYLDALVRGVYAKRDLPAGMVISRAAFADDFYLAIPLCKGQLSCREALDGMRLAKPVRADGPLMADCVMGAGAAGALRDATRDRGCADFPADPEAACQATGESAHGVE